MLGGNQILPHFTSRTETPRVITLYDVLNIQGPDVVLDSGNTDSGSSPTYIFRAGNVIVLRTSSGRYVEANDGNGDRDAAPSGITTSSHSDGNGTIKLVGNHGTISVTTTTGSGTEANNATDLNADGAFAKHYVATSGSNELTITAIGAGAREWFYMHADTMSSASFSEGVSNAVAGTDADYRVTANGASLENEVGTARHQPVANLIRAWFDESNLVNLTAEAKASLLRQGARFG